MSGPADGFDPVELVGEIAERTLDSEAVKNLLGPLTKNIGATLGLISDVARYYTEENLARIFAKWDKQRKGKPLRSDDFKRVLPLLRDAAMQSDEELQYLWASLLESVANQIDGVLPSFSLTLSQLTPQEARYLEKIFENVTAPRPYNSGKRHGRDALAYYQLINIYDPNLRAPSPAEMRVYKDRMSPEQLAAFDEMTNFELMLHDLERLSLLEKQIEYVAGQASKYRIGHEQIVIPSEKTGIKTRYALTQYGVNFILAVRPPQTP